MKIRFYVKYQIIHTTHKNYIILYTTINYNEKMMKKKRSNKEKTKKIVFLHRVEVI
jgi:hypothetical protein